MYYPYLRGKQYELVLLKENSNLIAESGIVPIIQPNKKGKTYKLLVSSIKELVKSKASFILISNPQVGDYKDDSSPISELINNLNLKEYDGFILGYIINGKSNKDVVKQQLEKLKEYKIALIHYGYDDGEILLSALKGLKNIKLNIFIEKFVSKKYRECFLTTGNPCVLVRDGFIIRRNEDYPDSEHFSELHLVFNTDYGMDGFGDFLIVGDDYRKGFTPFTVTIHLTYLDDNNDMHIKHYKSDQGGSTANIAGKFYEAVGKLVSDLNNKQSNIYESNACSEFTRLYQRAHFPALGYTKKLSMQHHIELIANFLSGVK